jgi:acetylornithine deacetylase/succinyl-diaminopimelate desuccinylase-like protein
VPLSYFFNEILPILNAFKTIFHSMTGSQNFIKENKERFLKELMDLLRIPSVSADPHFSKDVHATAELVATHLRSIGIDKVEICETKG